jgi:hypothetical protein
MDLRQASFRKVVFRFLRKMMRKPTSQQVIRWLANE